jgi:hypothetical protein
VGGKRRLLGLAALAAAALVVRRLGRRSGATNEELRTRWPGDELVPRPLWSSTRAITIEAAPRSVWPWIVQMGFPAHRAGWYTPHWLDRLQWGIRERSADEIRPELQDVQVGDRIPDSRDWSVFFTVAQLEPDRALVLHSTRHVLKPMRSIDFSWAFVLEPRGAEATRLVIRARARCEPRYALSALAPLLGIGDFLNASAMLRGIKSRTERTLLRDAGGDGGSTTRAAGRLRGLADVAAASPLFLTAPFYRRRHLRWGATDDEVAGEMPGDELVPETSFNATRAITIDAPPEDVWPWIVQIGFGRAGFYSYDLLDNAGRPSADRILAEFQQPKVGDWVPMASTVNETTAFKVKAFETNRWMLWDKPRSTWAWTLTPLQGGRTRLVVRIKDRYDWRHSPGNALLSLVLFELGDFPMMRRLLQGVKARAEHPRAYGPPTLVDDAHARVR